jgi:hypothetical protein
VENLAELPDVAAKIGIELRNEYQPQERSPRRKIPAGADPAGEDAGLPPFNAMFRTGYYAPTQ